MKKKKKKKKKKKNEFHGLPGPSKPGTLLNVLDRADLNTPLPAAAILRAGRSTYLTRHEIMDAELTREQPRPSHATPRPLTTTPH